MSDILRARTAAVSSPSLLAIVYTASIAAALLILAFARFNDVAGVIKPFLQRAADGSLYSLDLGIANSIVPKSSPIFTVLSALRLDLTHPAFLVGAYLACSVLAGVAVWRIVSRVFGVEDPWLQPFLLLAAAFAEQKLFPWHKADWLSAYNFSFTAVATALRFWFLYFALTGRHAAMCATLIPINFLTFKVGWLPTLVAAAAMIAARVSSKAAWAALAVSLAPVAYVQLFQPVSVAPEDARALFDAIGAAFGKEDNPFQAPVIGVALFLLGCAALWTGDIGAPRPAAKPFVRPAILISLATLVGGGFYLTIGYKVFAVPAIAWLSPMRALELASFLIYLSVAVKVLTTEKLGDPEKALIFLALVLYRTNGGGLTVIALAALALILIAALIYAARRYSARAARLLAAPFFDLRLLAILMLPLIVFQGVRMAEGWNRWTYRPALGFVSRNAPLGMLAAIRERPQDARYLFLAREGQAWVGKPEWNAAVRKSSLSGDAYYLTRASDIERQGQLDGFVSGVTGALDRGRDLSAGQRAKAKEFGVAAVVPASLRDRFPGWTEASQADGWLELKP